ncbi:MAG: hypothetical protein RJB66_423 [Pseudomonadota bacterium]|jgi:hypothetical protein
MKWQTVFVLCPIVVGLIGCSESPFPDYSKLEGLRILALKVDQPELQYNSSTDSYSIVMTPLLSDFGGSGNLELSLQGCLDPGIVVGAEPNCSDADVASSLTTVTVTPAVGAASDIFGDETRTGIPSTGSIAMTLPFPRTLWSSFSSVLQFNGVPYVIVAKVRSVDSGRELTAFRRVLLSNKSSLNTNPGLIDLKVSGNSLVSLPSEESLLAFESATNPENYDYKKSSGDVLALTEAFEVSWFITDGKIKSSRGRTGETVEWNPPTSAPSSGRKVIVVAVLRDGRGGIDYMIRAL